LASLCPAEATMEVLYARCAAAGRGGQVQCLGQVDEPDAEVLQFLERRQQILTDRPQRSNRQTSTTSISRRRAASSSFSRASRLAAPEFTSRTCRAIVQAGPKHFRRSS
jgi:hypothetical protein